MAPLSSTDFLTQLAKLFESSKTTGSVFVTTKKAVGFVKKADRTQAATEEAGSSKAKVAPLVPGAVLVRATNSKTKLSTVVSQADMFKFHTAYMGLVKSQMTSLKKKERKSRAAKKKASKTAAGTASSSGELAAAAAAAAAATKSQ